MALTTKKKTIACWHAITLAFLIGAGCAAHRPGLQTYRLVSKNAAPLLIPPGIAAPDVVRRTFTAQISAGHGTCPAAPEGIRIRVGKTGARVSVAPETLANQPDGWLRDWAEEIESKGCVAKGEGSKLADQVVESVPLAPNKAFRLRYSSDLDISPPVRIEVVSPILRQSPDREAQTQEALPTSPTDKGLTVGLKSAPNLIGYEIAWYEVRPNTGRLGFTIAPLYAERHIGDETERQPKPATNYFNFPEDVSFYRLFHKAQQTQFTAFLTAAHTRAELKQESQTLDMANPASCMSLNGKACLEFPRDVAVNLLAPVTVNGREVMVRWGSAVGEAIRSAGGQQNTSLLPRLTVERRYDGRSVPVEFDRSSPAIFGLILTGGEVISWK
jgi:hypothetical protein